MHFKNYYQYSFYGYFLSLEERKPGAVWNAVSATDFENEARGALIKSLSENSTGNVNSLVNGYLSHLRRFRLFNYRVRCP